MLLVDVAAFLAVDTINAYYLAALAPATSALVGVGVELVASRSAAIGRGASERR